MSKVVIIIVVAIFFVCLSKNSLSYEKTRYHISGSLRNSFTTDKLAPMIGFSTEQPFKINDKYWGFGITGDYIFSDINEADIGLKLYSNAIGDLLFTASTNLKLVFFEEIDIYAINPDVDYNENNGTKAFLGFVVTSGMIIELSKTELIPQIGLEIYNNNVGLIFGVNWKI